MPPGCVKAGLSQVISCDKAAWAHLASLNVADPDGTFPLGGVVVSLRNDPAISLTWHLLPSRYRLHRQRPGPSSTHASGVAGKDLQQRTHLLCVQYKRWLLSQIFTCTDGCPTSAGSIFRLVLRSSSEDVTRLFFRRPGWFCACSAVCGGFNITYWCFFGAW